jgi:protein PET100
MVRTIGGILEIFKFTIYVSLPIGVIYVISDPKNLRKMLDSTQYVVYPPEGPRPPTGSLEDVRAHAAQLKNLD